MLLFYAHFGERARLKTSSDLQRQWRKMEEEPSPERGIALPGLNSGGWALQA